MTSKLFSSGKYILATLCFLIFMTNAASAQDNRIIRIAKIQIDPAQLKSYQAAVKEQIETAMKVEPGVLLLYAVHDKKVPTNVTVFEIYADTAAYQSHIQTTHFKKYKASTAHMVKSLELTDVTAIELAQKH
jgi:quinol monooxygenase YgiN